MTYTVSGGALNPTQTKRLSVRAWAHSSKPAAAIAGSATFTADVGSWTRTCFGLTGLVVITKTIVVPWLVDDWTVKPRPAFIACHCSLINILPTISCTHIRTFAGHHLEYGTFCVLTADLYAGGVAVPPRRWIWFLIILSSAVNALKLWHSCINGHVFLVLLTPQTWRKQI